ncbi:DsbA family protein [Alphaproteobacteria bacterium]|nr:DsbA family protein [Alphaproteobacteria bacterium]
MKKIIRSRTKNESISIIILLITLIFLFPIPSHSHEIKKDEIEKIIKKFLVNNPELITYTLENYKINLEKQKFKNAVKTLEKIKNPGIFQKNATITIYEFFDYNCVYCKSVLKVVLETLSEDKNINFVFVEYPILSQQSYTTSIAALASRKQGLYNEFHSSLMSLRGKISENKIFNTAKKIGLDIEQLKVEMNNPEIKDQLLKNRKIAKLLDLNGTPAFIIGDIIYPGAIDKEKLKKMIKNFRES